MPILVKIENMTISKEQQLEIEKYTRAYDELDSYGMGLARKMAATRHLMSLPVRGSLIDIGSGRGEMLRIARWLKFHPVRGIDPATYSFVQDTEFGLATSIPVAPKSYDVLTSFDMMEHLFKEDHILALKEMERVAKRFIIIAAADFPHVAPDGTVWHISYMPDAEWEKLFKSVFENVELLPRHESISSTWKITL